MPLMIWWRKTWWLFPSALAIMFLVMRNVQPVEGINPGWSVNWGWMLGVWNGGTLLLSPFMAACVNAGRKLTPCCRSKIDPSHGCCWFYLVGWRRWPRVR